jgi:hypothetical protein
VNTFVHRQQEVFKSHPPFTSKKTDTITSRQGLQSRERTSSALISSTRANKASTLAPWPRQSRAVVVIGLSLADINEKVLRQQSMRTAVIGMTVPGTTLEIRFFFDSHLPSLPSPLARGDTQDTSTGGSESHISLC